MFQLISDYFRKKKTKNYSTVNARLSYTCLDREKRVLKCLSERFKTRELLNFEKTRAPCAGSVPKREEYRGASPLWGSRIEVRKSSLG